MQNLLLELRILESRSHAYVCLGVLLEESGLAQRLQKLVWTDICEVTHRPHAQVWKFKFVCTLVRKPVDDQWNMKLGVQMLPILGAICFNRPWCVCTYKAPEGEEGDRWHVGASFELWSHRAAHIKSLLESAQNVASAAGPHRALLARMAVRGDVRSGEVPEGL